MQGILKPDEILTLSVDQQEDLIKKNDLCGGSIDKFV
jgi:hypothetical protein